MQKNLASLQDGNQETAFTDSKPLLQAKGIEGLKITPPPTHTHAHNDYRTSKPPTLKEFNTSSEEVTRALK